MTAFRIGIVGGGRLTEAGYLPAARIAGVAVAGVAEPDFERRALLGGLGAATHPSAEALLASGRLDALVVASPPETHEQLAALAAEHGVPALVEKPPAPDLAGARRIAALEPPPYIGFNRRFSLGAAMAGAVPAGGTIALEIRYRRFRWSPVSVRDLALLDLAPHLADLALWGGVGAPRGVAARSERPERVEIELEGERASATIRCATDRAHRERLVVRDSGGRRVAARQLGGVRGLAGRLRRGPHPLVASLVAQLGELADAVAGRDAPNLGTAADGVGAMSIVAAAAESLALGGEPVRPEPGSVRAR